MLLLTPHSFILLLAEGKKILLTIRQYVYITAIKLKINSFTICAYICVYILCHCMVWAKGGEEWRIRLRQIKFARAPVQSRLLSHEEERYKYTCQESATTCEYVRWEFSIRVCKRAPANCLLKSAPPHTSAEYTLQVNRKFYKLEVSSSAERIANRIECAFTSRQNKK